MESTSSVYIAVDCNVDIIVEPPEAVNDPCFTVATLFVAKFEKLVLTGVTAVPVWENDPFLIKVIAIPTLAPLFEKEAL